jgi:hypothetical protein
MDSEREPDVRRDRGNKMETGMEKGKGGRK